MQDSDHPMPDWPRCQETTARGTQCKFRARYDETTYCGIHRKCREPGCDERHRWWCGKVYDPLCRTHAEEHFDSCPSCAALFRHFYGGRWE